MGCRENYWRNGIQKNVRSISLAKKILLPLTANLRLILILFLVLFPVLFALPLFGQNFSDNNPNINPQPHETDIRQYTYSNGNKIIDKPDSHHEQINNTKSYPLKRKIQKNQTNNNELQNNFINQQEEERINKQTAIKKIPWDELSPPMKQKLSLIVQNHSIYHQLPTQAIFCDPEVYQYFLEHPDLLVGFWECLGLTQIALRETDTDRFNLVETTGTVADVGLFYRSTNCCVVYARGEYKSPITPRKIDGEALLILQSRYARNIENEPIIVCKLDVFVKIDSIGADLLVKLFATTLGKIADGNFEQTLGFVSHVSDTSAISANSVKKLTKSVKNVRPEVRNDFADIIDRVAIRASRRVEKRLYNYHRENKTSDDFHNGQNKTVAPILKHYETQQNIESIALNNEFQDQRTEIKFDSKQDTCPTKCPTKEHNK
jgi:hypothetical protein